MSPWEQSDERADLRSLDALDLAVVEGHGVIARYSRIILIALPMTSAEADFMDDLLSVTEMAAAQAGLPGRTLARRVAGLLALSESETAPPFCVLAECETGTAVLLHGDLEVEVTGARQLLRLSGRGVLSWIDNVITDSYDRISVVPADHPETVAQPWTNLGRGVVRGDGAILGRRTAPATVTAQQCPAVNPGAATSAIETPDPESSSSLTVADNRAPPATRTTRPSPFARTVTTDQGGSFDLDTSYIIGRQPELHASVRDGSARPLVLDDPEEFVSRVHARVIVTPQGIQVVDEGSGNGTFMATPDSTSWIPLLAGVPVQVARGTRLRVGDRELIFD